MTTKNLSLLLATLLGASLTACNSGAGSPISKSTNQVNNTESVTTQEIIVGATDKNIGFVGTDNGDLEYYDNDKFIKIVHKFEDKVSKLYIANVQTDNITVYVATHSENHELYINKCVLETATTATTCNRIDTYDDVGADTPPYSSMFFDLYGNGYVMLGTTKSYFVDTDNNKYSRLGKYISNTLVWTKYIKETFLSDNKALESPQILKDDNGVIQIAHYHGVASVDTNSNDLKASSVIQDTYGVFGIKSLDQYYNGFSLSYNNIYRIIDGHRVSASLHKFIDEVSEMSTTNDSVYVVTKGKELKKCNYDGNCATIDKFHDIPKAVAFQNF
ncbi:MAG TPA: hypothetical protein DHV02_05540 [Neisseriales bacterium]|jgi:hypothetical protein|nr:hypothetical protein [Burkholderiales bacterium]MBP9768004.1 hypothetical protein [Burkholderiales bacterium]HCY39309.1 hypothetical protein [Neisseriales bacterium]